MIAGGKSVRTFANLPGAEPAATDDRLRGLAPEARSALLEASQRISRGELGAAEQLLRGILATSPDHSETLRMLAVAYQRGGHTAEAIGVVRHAQRSNPSDALLMNTLGSLLQNAGDIAGAGTAFRRACELDPNLASAWMNLGTNLQIRSDMRQAESAFARAVEIQPASIAARIAHALALNALGRTDESIAGFRAAIATNPRAVLAWAGLAEIKTVALSTDDIAVLERLVVDHALNEEERAIAGFALGRGLEDQQRYPDAFAAFANANAAMRSLMPWDAAAHSAYIDSIAAAFETPPALAGDAARGSDVVFVISLPRAGSTLVEQVLGAHPDVEGAGEINDLALILQEESARRGERYPAWIGKANAEDWQRLGAQYLERTARWRSSRRVHVDKAVFNWPFVGAIVAMLPGARIVNVRRDAVETGWSCFKQRFVRGAADVLVRARRHRRALDRLRPADVLLARALSAAHLRSVVRGARRVARGRDPASARFLRPFVRGELPEIAQERPRRAHGERGAGAPTDACRHRAFGKLRHAARSTAPRARSVEPVQSVHANAGLQRPTTGRAA